MKLRIRIPATTANLGSGFDCIGAALKLYNEFEIEFVKTGSLTVEIRGEGKKSLPAGKNNIIISTINEVLKAHKYNKPVNAHILIKNNIPVARGLGSSATAYLAGAITANKLLKNKLSNRELLSIVAKKEGHPDNAVPSLLGGICIASCDNDFNCRWERLIPPKDIKVVIGIPEFELSTKKARNILPDKIPIKDAVFNMSRVALLTLALLQKKYELLSVAMEDRLHQPYREKLVPGLREIINKTRAAGAYGAALSGAGPSVISLCNPNNTEKIAKLIQNIWISKRIKSRCLILDFDNTGTQIISIS